MTEFPPIDTIRRKIFSRKEHSPDDPRTGRSLWKMWVGLIADHSRILSLNKAVEWRD